MKHKGWLQWKKRQQPLEKVGEIANATCIFSQRVHPIHRFRQVLKHHRQSVSLQ